MKTSSLSSEQFCQLKISTIEKRTLAYYKNFGDDTLLLRETAMLHILESLKDNKENCFFQKKTIESFYVNIYRSGKVTSPWFVFLWSFFKNYFSRKIICFMERLFKQLDYLNNFFQKLLIFQLTFQCFNSFFGVS